MDCRGKTALITGASSGIGIAFAEVLAQRGADVVLVARSGPALEYVATRLRAEYGIRADTIAQDLTTAGAAEAVKAETNRRGLHIEVLVNNAGFASAGRFDEVPARRSRLETALDVAAVVDLTSEYLPGMVRSGTGVVINVASTSAFQPTPYMSVYGAAKAFVLSFSQALWAEYRRSGVNVLALCPGPVETNFFEVLGTREIQTGQRKSAEAVVRAALRGVDRGRFMVTPGVGNAAMHAVYRLLPRRVVLSGAERRLRRARSHPAGTPVASAT